MQERAFCFQWRGSLEKGREKAPRFHGQLVPHLGQCDEGGTLLPPGGGGQGQFERQELDPSHLPVLWLPEPTHWAGEAIKHQVPDSKTPRTWTRAWWGGQIGAKGG